MGIVELLAKHLDKSTEDIGVFLVDAAKKYKVYKIPKRTHGHRVIAQPSRELKRYQRVFLDHWLLPIHPCAMAYRKGLSIKDNAEAHRRQRYLLKMDLENFFNSIDPPLFWKVWDSHQAVLPELFPCEKRILEQLLFWCPSKKTGGKLILSVGAPSSPMISNFCLHNFDNTLTAHCQTLGITYTRYADDLTFSTNRERELFQIPTQMRKMLHSEFGNRITLNHAKTAFSSMAHNRHVTGITLSNNGMLSLGRTRKRYIKHLVHQFCNGLLAKEDLAHLRGLLAHARHIEPDFLHALGQKYSRETLRQISEA
jgi:RNA-directed DNA polymerase